MDDHNLWSIMDDHDFPEEQEWKCADDYDFPEWHQFYLNPQCHRSTPCTLDYIAQYDDSKINPEYMRLLWLKDSSINSLNRILFVPYCEHDNNFDVAYASNIIHITQLQAYLDRLYSKLTIVGDDTTYDSDDIIEKTLFSIDNDFYNHITELKDAYEHEEYIMWEIFERRKDLLSLCE